MFQRLLLLLALTGCSPAFPRDFELSYESRGVGEGIPVLYRFTIHGDGRVEYFGKRGVKLLGHHEGRIDPARARELLGEAEGLHLLDLRGDYSPKGWSDLSNIELSLRQVERRNSVEFAWFHPEEPGWKPSTAEEEIGAQLAAFGSRLESAVNVWHWIGTADEVYANHFWLERDHPSPR